MACLYKVHDFAAIAMRYNHPPNPLHNLVDDSQTHHPLPLLHVVASGIQLPGQVQA